MCTAVYRGNSVLIKVCAKFAPKMMLEISYVINGECRCIDGYARR